ncbi:MAG: hypothetical protein RLZZ127_2368 [Planctomycetota bacterium]|jgi:bifunctional DNase/RNase
MTLIPCRMTHLVIDEQSEHQSVHIGELIGGRRFPIGIGAQEAIAIDRALKRSSFARPLTHDLCAALLDATDTRLSEIRILDLRDGVFFAELRLRRADGTEVPVDCRPSDALALLARRPGTPLLVADHVLNEAAAG